MGDDGNVRKSVEKNRNDEETLADESFRAIFERVSQLLCRCNPCYCGTHQTASSSTSESSINKDRKKKKQGKRKSETESVSLESPVSPYVKKKREPLKRKRSIDDLRSPSLNRFPALQRILQQEEMMMEMKFLYRKWIEKSDVNCELNRLLMTKSEELMEFMTVEERRKMTAKKGIEVRGYDSDGRVYMFNITKWTSQDQPVINRGSWRKLVNDNNVEEGQMIEIWGGRRREGELVLIVNFRKGEETEEEDQSNAGSGSNTEGGSAMDDNCSGAQVVIAN